MHVLITILTYCTLKYKNTSIFCVRPSVCITSMLGLGGRRQRRRRTTRGTLTGWVSKSGIRYLFN